MLNHSSGLAAKNGLRRVVVTGLGAVTPLGVGVQTSWERLIRGDSGIVSLPQHRGDAYAALPSRVAGLVPRGSSAAGGWDASEHLSNDEQHRMADFTQFAMAAGAEAFASAGWRPTTPAERAATGVSLGSGIGAFSDVYDTSLAFAAHGYRKVSPLFVPRLLINLGAGHLAMRHGLRGPNVAAATACTTGAHALADAARLVAAGDADAMLAGAAEACVHPLAVAGFARARSLATAWNGAPERASRPFDAARGGFVIGEGAGVVLLEALDHVRARGGEARVVAELAGYGLTCDAAHLTAPRADGAGAAQAMARALARAGVAPRDVGYVNAHGTGTALGDAAENRAVQDVLLGRGEFAAAAAAARGEVHRAAGDINVSSTKGATGHLLGAAGAVEAIFTMLALKEGVLPPTLNLDDVGDRGPDGEGEAEWGCNYIPRVAQRLASPPIAALTNSFGFGGTNASLCFTRYVPGS